MTKTIEEEKESDEASESEKISAKQSRYSRRIKNYEEVKSTAPKKEKNDAQCQ